MGVILVTVIVFVVERSQISNTEICTLSTFFILIVFYTPASGCNCQKKKVDVFPTHFSEPAGEDAHWFNTTLTLRNNCDLSPFKNNPALQPSVAGSPASLFVTFLLQRGHCLFIDDSACLCCRPTLKKVSSLTRSCVGQNHTFLFNLFAQNREEKCLIWHKEEKKNAVQSIFCLSVPPTGKIHSFYELCDGRPIQKHNS